MTCYNDVFAISLMAILQKEGMKLPEDMEKLLAEAAEPLVTERAYHRLVSMMRPET